MTPSTRRWFFCATCLLGACQQKTVDGLPPFAGSPVDNLVGCAELRAAPPILEDSTFATAAGPAGCGSDGLFCPLGEGGSPPELCSPDELALAHCERDRWRLLCRPLEDPAAGGAGAGGAAVPPEPALAGAAGSPAGR